MAPVLLTTCDPRPIQIDQDEAVWSGKS